MSSVSIGRARTGTKRAAGARRARGYDGPEPWARRDVFVVSVVLAVAVAGLVVGWFGISDTVDLDSQTGWLGFGIGALIVGGFAMVAWLLIGLRRVALLRREVLRELDQRHPEPDKARTPVLTPSQQYGTTTGMRRYHAADCQLLDGKDATFAGTAAHEQAGLAACPICIGAGGVSGHE